MNVLDSSKRQHVWQARGWPNTRAGCVSTAV